MTLYEQGDAGATYVGDSRLSATPAGEKRLLSFALDQKTTIEEDDSDTTSLARARIAKGVLTLDDLTRRRTVFRVKATRAAPADRAMSRKLEGGKLTAAAGDRRDRGGGPLSRALRVKAGDGQKFAVEQERTQTREVALAKLDDAALDVYVEVRRHRRGNPRELQKLADAARRAGRPPSARSAKRRRRSRQITADQTRLKELLGAVAGGSDLSKRYLRKLDADETRAGISWTPPKAHARRRATRRARAVEAFLAGV